MMKGRVMPLAITKLGNIKESKKGSPSAHLRRSIFYIVNPQKTEEGKWVGSNCGVTPEEIYDSMMFTKKLYGKEWGRQGYHFVLSFPPGEADERRAYDIGKEFCEELLSEYDYVYAVHNDQAHMHVHIVFNSVSRIDSYKYRYENGDWQKMIQPVTDRLCEKYGLSTLEYDPDMPRADKRYNEQTAHRNGNFTEADIICMDIDEALKHASELEGIYDFLRSKGYEIRQGYSKKQGRAYVSFTMPGAKRARRDYKLPEGYRLPNIIKRLNGENLECHTCKELREKWDELLPEKVRLDAGDDLPIYHIKFSSDLPNCMTWRIYRIVFRFQADLKRRDEEWVRRDMLRLGNLREELDYMTEHNIRSVEGANERLKDITARIRTLKYEDGDLTETEELHREKRILKHIIKDSVETMKVNELAIRRRKQKEFSGDKDYIPKPVTEDSLRKE